MYDDFDEVAFEAGYQDAKDRANFVNARFWKVYQIQLTDREIDLINEAGEPTIVPKYAAKCGMDFSDNIAVEAVEAFEKGYYDHVCNIVTDYDGFLDRVFEYGNVGPEERIDRVGSRMSSVSVGDIIEAEDGTRHVVARFGFEEL